MAKKVKYPIKTLGYSTLSVYEVTSKADQLVAVSIPNQRFQV